MGIENKVNENLPAVMERDSLDKVMNEATYFEHALMGFICAYGTGFALLNFGEFTTPWNEKQTTRINKFHFKYARESSLTNASRTVYSLGFSLGTIAELGTELGFGLALTYLLGIPLALSTYFGAKVLTNTIGYFHYKKQRKKHETLEKMGYLSEEKK